MRIWILALASVTASAGAQTADTLHVSLDLRAAIEAGWLDPASETVGLRGGTAPLSWDATLRASDPDDDGVYELAVPFDGRGDVLRFLFPPE